MTAADKIILCDASSRFCPRFHLPFVWQPYCAGHWPQSTASARGSKRNGKTSRRMLNSLFGSLGGRPKEASRTIISINNGVATRLNRSIHSARRLARNTDQQARARGIGWRFPAVPNGPNLTSRDFRSAGGKRTKSRFPRRRSYLRSFRCSGWPG